MDPCTRSVRAKENGTRGNAYPLDETKRLMRITIAYNLRTDHSEKTAELLSSEDVDRLTGAIASLSHTATKVEVSGKPNDVVDRLLASEPDLIFNVAEGTIGSSREAFYPGLYEQLGIPFTGGNASLLHLNLDKHLAARNTPTWASNRMWSSRS